VCVCVVWNISCDCSNQCPLNPVYTGNSSLYYLLQERESSNYKSAFSARIIYLQLFNPFQHPVLLDNSSKQFFMLFLGMKTHERVKTPT